MDNVKLLSRGYMQKCPCCGYTKEVSEFYMRSDRKGKTHSYCKKCVNAQTLKRQRELKIKCIEYKGGKCLVCGVEGHPAIFDFHHRNPNDKDFNIAKVRSLKFSEKHTTELDKCDLLCSNCHRVEHAKF